MIYLKSFILPKDEWVDCFFSKPRPEHIPMDLPWDMPKVHSSTAVNSWYPWNTFYGRGIREFFFQDITILYGGNGSGKTTLLNIIAQKLRLMRTTRYNRSSFFDDYIRVCKYEKVSGTEKIIQQSRIVTSDDVFEEMLDKRKENDDKDIKREDLFWQYHFGPTEPLPTHNLTDPEVLAKYKQLLKESKMSCSKFIKSRLEANRIEYSNGETAFQYFVNAVQDNTLVLLDEPENSLSAKWQIELGTFLSGAARALGCKLIIATHSPFLLAIPGARIYDLDSQPIKRDKWYNLESIRLYHSLFKENEHLFQEE